MKTDVLGGYYQYVLHAAVANGHEDILELLLQQSGSDLDKKNHRGQTSILLAAEKGHLSVVQLLLGKGADPNISDEDGTTPLSIALEHKHSLVAETLRECGAH